MMFAKFWVAAMAAGVMGALALSAPSAHAQPSKPPAQSLRQWKLLNLGVSCPWLAAASFSGSSPVAYAGVPMTWRG